MEEIKIKNLNVLNERRQGLRPATTLFYYYVDNVDELNRIKKTKDELALALNVSARTVSNWARALVNAGVIKYKYSGVARLNPKIYYVGTRLDYVKALSEFENFKSDI